ncbi:HIT family protein [Corynebacterium sp. S7]
MPHDGASGNPELPSYTDTGVGEPDALQRLWAPYRANYIAQVPEDDASSSSESSDDPFTIAPTKSDEDALIVARGTYVYLILNLYPYNSGHMMVVPYRKVAELENLNDAETSELMVFLKRSIRVLKKVSAPESINVGLNLGRASGGSVGDHLHMHVVPRWTGDANFLTVLDGTKVLPQLLRDTRTLMAQGWNAVIAEENSRA